VVVLQIYVYRIGFLEPECDSPIPRYRHRISAFTIALEAMTAQAGKIHVLGPHRGIETIQDPSNPVRLTGVDAAPVTLGEKPLQTLVADTADHVPV